MIAGIGDESVRQLSEWTLENEHKELMENIDGLKFMPNGIKLVHKSFSVGDLLIQFHRMFNLVFVKGFKQFLLTLVGYFLLCIFFQTFFDRKMLRANTCKLIIEDEINSNQTCGYNIDDHHDSDMYLLFQGCILFILGVPITCVSANLFGPLLLVFRNEHRNGR